MSKYKYACYTLLFACNLHNMGPTHRDVWLTRETQLKTENSGDMYFSTCVLGVWWPQLIDWNFYFSTNFYTTTMGPWNMYDMMFADYWLLLQTTMQAISKSKY